MSSNNFYSSKYDVNKEPELKKELDKAEFAFKSINHAIWSAQSKEVTVTLYLSGKLLVQGKGTQDFVNKYIEKTSVQTELVLPKEDKKQENKYDCWIGTDESGKGDYFGPLVIAGVLVDQNNIKKFQELGIKDSKKIKDEIIEKLAWQIKANSTFSIVTINPAKYNQLYAKFKNLNSLLAWGHARAIENILEKKECQKAISDKFGDEKFIQKALLTHGKTIELEQRVRAEEDIAVAAASILARNEFVQRMKKMSQEYNIDLKKGASEQVKDQARLFIQKYGLEKLENIAKLHFKTTKEVTQLKVNSKPG